MARASAGGPVYVTDREVGVSLLCVTFDPWQLLPRACEEVKGEAMAVNEADYTSVKGEHYMGDCTPTRDRCQSEVKWSRQNFEVGQAVKVGSLETVNDGRG